MIFLILGDVSEEEDQGALFGCDGGMRKRFFY